MKTAKDLMGKLEITKQEALELLEVEEAYQEWYRGGECTFKKWNDRIYITFSERSATANKKKSYYDLEAGLLHDTYVKFEADRTEEAEEVEENEEVLLDKKASVIKDDLEKALESWEELDIGLNVLKADNVAESFMIYEKALDMDFTWVDNHYTDPDFRDIAFNLKKDMNMVSIKKEAKKMIEVSEELEVGEYENPKEFIKELEKL